VLSGENAPLRRPDAASFSAIDPGLGIVGTVHKPDASRGASPSATAYLATLDHPESAGTRRVYASTLRALRAEFGKDSDLAPPYSEGM
jgi:hypothetical protein